MKKIFLSLVTILAVGAAATGATGAFFTSTATSSANTFASGTMVVNLTDVNETTPASAVTASFGGTTLAPGSSIPEQSIQVHSTGTVNGNHLDLTVSLGPSAAELNKYLIFTGPDGLRFGPSKASSINLLAVLTGGADSDYTVTDGDTGAALGDISGLDGVAGLSMRDLDIVGKIRITPALQNAGVFAGTTATLWQNITVGTGLTTQGESVNATYSWKLDQDASQF